MKTRAFAIAAILAIAANLRLPNLAERPMHADEAILAYKLGTLLETGKWTYDPAEHHGPVLHYLTAGVARLEGVRRYAELNETLLRMVPAMIGMITVFVPLLLARSIGWAPAIIASALTAISPAMVYYSRYYISEMLLVCLTGILIAIIQERKFLWMLGAGVVFGLMFATKETAIIAAGCVLVGAFSVQRHGFEWRHLLAAAAVAIGVIVTLLGPAETLQAIAVYVKRAVQGERHVHSWHYYLGLLLGPEFGIVLLALGALAVVRSNAFIRFLAVYTLCMTVVYSVIPYKTPWCVLGMLQGFILLAGIGVAHAARSKRGAVVLLAAFALIVGVRAVWLADASNPYAYANTTRDVYTVRDRLEQLGRDLPVQVISAENVWPLPWYLRAFPNVEWRRDVSVDMRPAPVILATLEVESALMHQLYEVPPPGQRPLYANLFPDRMELRPGVELRGYVQLSALNAPRGP